MVSQQDLVVTRPHGLHDDMGRWEVVEFGTEDCGQIEYKARDKGGGDRLWDPILQVTANRSAKPESHPSHPGQT